jgi:hypothetical protein
MKATEAILIRWRREDPDRLLQAALRQARELAELLPELDGLRSQSAMLRQQLEIQTKRIAQLEEALQGAERAAYRQARVNIARTGAPQRVAHLWLQTTHFSRKQEHFEASSAFRFVQDSEEQLQKAILVTDHLEKLAAALQKPECRASFLV